jgi:hypothetical protein
MAWSVEARINRHLEIIFFGVTVSVENPYVPALVSNGFSQYPRYHFHILPSLRKHTQSKSVLLLQYFGGFVGAFYERPPQRVTFDKLYEKALGTVLDKTMAVLRSKSWLDIFPDPDLYNLFMGVGGSVTEQEILNPRSILEGYRFTVSYKSLPFKLNLSAGILERI